MARRLEHTEGPSRIVCSRGAVLGARPDEVTHPALEAALRDLWVFPMQSAFPAVYTTLATDLRAPARARDEIGLACHGLSTSTIETAKLLVSELVTNAVVHGADDLDLAIARTHALLRVEVSDAGGYSVRPVCDTHGDYKYGPGPHIVAALATAWGCRPGLRSGGKMVWFELRLDTSAIDVVPTATDGTGLTLRRQRLPAYT